MAEIGPQVCQLNVHPAAPAVVGEPDGVGLRCETHGESLGLWDADGVDVREINRAGIAHVRVWTGAPDNLPTGADVIAAFRDLISIL